MRERERVRGKYFSSPDWVWSKKRRTRSSSFFTSFSPVRKCLGHINTRGWTPTTPPTSPDKHSHVLCVYENVCHSSLSLSLTNTHTLTLARTHKGRCFSVVSLQCEEAWEEEEGLLGLWRMGMLGVKHAFGASCQPAFHFLLIPIYLSYQFRSLFYPCTWPSNLCEWIPFMIWAIFSDS